MDTSHLATNIVRTHMEPNQQLEKFDNTEGNDTKIDATTVTSQDDRHFLAIINKTISPKRNIKKFICRGKIKSLNCRTPNH